MADFEDTSTLERPKAGPVAGSVPSRSAAAPAPSPPSAPAPAAAPAPAPAVAGGFASGLSDMLGGGQRALGTLRRADEASRGLDERAATLSRDLEALKAKVAHPPTAQQTDPVQAFGSAAMFLATMGSLMTRRPLLNALRAGADVMDAYRKNDLQAAQQAFQNWKAETDAAMTIHRFEQDAYRAAVDKVQRDREGAKTDLAVTAAAMKDEVVLHLVESGRMDDAINVIAGRRVAGGRMGAAGAAATTANARRQFYAKFQAAKTPEERAQVEQEYNDWLRFNDPTAARAAAKPGKLENYEITGDDGKPTIVALRQTSDGQFVDASNAVVEGDRIQRKAGTKVASVKPPPDTNIIASEKIQQENARRKAAGQPEMTEAEQAQVRIREAQAARTEAIPPAERAGYQRVINNSNAGMEHADRAISIMNNTVLAAGGLARLGRAAETIGNLVGASDSTARQDFKRAIIMLKQDESQSANTSGARPMVAQMKLIDQLLETDQWGVSSRAVFSALNDIQSELYRRRQLAEAQLNQSWSPDMRIQELDPVPFGGATQRSQQPSGFDAFPTVPR